MNPSLMEILITDLQLDPHALRPESRLEDAGLDSLTLVELSVQLRDRSGVQVGEDELSSATTVGALDRMVEQRLNGK
ncbi:MAG: acyl carrier protein [Pseudonocardiaceae bacterium]